MILYEGRTILWKGRKVVIVGRVGCDRVKLASVTNPKMMWIVKAIDLQKRPKEW